MQGVYLITNIINGNQYVGQSVNIERRWMEHKTPNASLKSKRKNFVRDIAKYGIDAFLFAILDVCKSHELRKREQYWIERLHPVYNYDGKHTDETRKRLAEAARKQWERMSDEQKDFIKSHNLIGPRKGHPVSEETREKLRNANLGTSKFAVRVVETGKVYQSMKDCAKALNRTYFSVINQLKGKTRSINGYHLERVETTRDECNGVGQRRELVEVRDCE